MERLCIHKHTPVCWCTCWWSRCDAWVKVLVVLYIPAYLVYLSKHEISNFIRRFKSYIAMFEWCVIKTSKYFCICFLYLIKPLQWKCTCVTLCITSSSIWKCRNMIKNKIKAKGRIHTEIPSDQRAWSLFRGRFYDVLWGFSQRPTSQMNRTNEQLCEHLS